LEKKRDIEGGIFTLEGEYVAVSSAEHLLVKSCCMDEMVFCMNEKFSFMDDMVSCMNDEKFLFIVAMVSSIDEMVFLRVATSLFSAFISLCPCAS